jgi:uncharacterized protein with FMN-binding domain
LRTDERRPPAPPPPRPRPADLAGPPRRALVTLVATAIGLVLLFSFKTPDSPTVGDRPSPVAVGLPRAGGSSVATPAPGGSAATAGGTRKVDGDVIGTRFGDVQVRLIESGGRITDIQALRLPFDRQRSNEISQFVEPILRSEALQAQSAQIDTVSGATYTSDAYDMSLQSAIDRAGG